MKKETGGKVVKFSVDWRDADGNEVVNLVGMSEQAFKDFPLSLLPGDTVSVTRTDGCFIERSRDLHKRGNVNARTDRVQPPGTARTGERKQKMTDLEELLAYVQAAKKTAAVAGHQGHSSESDSFQMGKAAAYYDIEKLLMPKITERTDR